MRETYELVVVDDILTETSDSYAHTAVDVTVESCLRTIVFLEVCNELFGCAGKSELLRLTLKLSPSLEDLFLCGLVFKLYKYSRCVSVCYGNSDALCL